ncbi:hypothetical protein EDB86DRAFT_2835890 [Lactarius hatsudake]|nr:hypothetical protein EDB86DRAFT_2835890 [Lactarius hatsudake]
MSAATASILENVITVSKEFLNDAVPSSPATIQSFREVEAHLTAIVHNSRSSGSPLPEKEAIPPNQHTTWRETAKRMGATRQPKRPWSTSASPPEPSATTCIGDLNHKRLRVKITDLYSGGVSSGRSAAPDVQTAAQNAEMRARTAVTANPLSQPPQPPKHGSKCAAPSTPPPAGNTPSQPLELSHMHAGTSSAHPPPSVPTTWYPQGYPIPATYPSGMYTYTLYHSAYPAYWPYGYSLPSLPQLRPPQ